METAGNGQGQGMTHEALERIASYVSDGWMEDRRLEAEYQEARKHNPDAKRKHGAGWDIYLHGPAGTGKSTLARLMIPVWASITGDARILSINGGVPWFSGPLRNEIDVIGYKDGVGRYHESMIHRAFANGGILLLDEMDGSDASVLLLLNDALANRQLSTAAGAVKQDGAPLLVIGTGNTVAAGAESGYVRNAQDISTLDRMTTVPVGYDRRVEDESAGSAGLAAWFRALRDRLNRDGRDYPISYRSMARVGRGFSRARSSEERARILYDCTPLLRVQPDVLRMILPEIQARNDGSDEYTAAMAAYAVLVGRMERMEAL